MVKGTSKRIVVVKSPDPKVFEQAIFIVREDFLKGRAGSTSDILREAQDVANRYIRSTVRTPGRRLPRLPPAAFSVFGVLFAAAVWATLHFTGVLP